MSNKSAKADTDYLEICLDRNGIPMVKDDKGIWHEPHMERRHETGEHVYIWGSFRKPKWRPYEGGQKEVG